MCRLNDDDSTGSEREESALWICFSKVSILGTGRRPDGGKLAQSVQKDRESAVDYLDRNTASRQRTNRNREV